VRLREALRDTSGDLKVELSGATYLDGGAAAVLLELDREFRLAGRRLQILGTCPPACILGLLDWEKLAASAPPTRGSGNGFIAYVGQKGLEIWEEARRMATFAGDLALCGLRVLWRPRLLRWGETSGLIVRAGVDALPIVILISTLMGLIMAFLGAVQLKRFGANIYVADMVALAMVRELGPIMTGILVAGRSGSGFAAELGTMALDDEVDALRVMGFDPTAFLALPRVLAVVAAMPVLALFSDLAGVIGGLFVGLAGLDLALIQYLEETRRILTLGHLFMSVGKAMFFGLLVAGIGCSKGLHVVGGAEGVGRAATSAVVTGIFLIIVADALFAIVTTYSPW
jgi:phospholipid/cholesterol/gamma-HCH transport system permease protein